MQAATRICQVNINKIMPRKKETITGNENKNQPEIPKAKLEKLGILKVLGVVISEDEETKYRVITNEGETKFVPASKLLAE